MNMTSSIGTVYKNYFHFGGRSRRSEYWFFALFCFLVSLTMIVIEVSMPNAIASIVSMISGMISLFNFIPSLAVAIRRLHDAGKSGWNFLWALIPLLGWIYVLYVLCQPTDGPNKWGAGPIAPNPI